MYMREVLADAHLSKTGLARYLDRSTRWVDYRLSGPNPPPGFKLGKTWIFKKSEIDSWLEKFRAGSHLDKLVSETMVELEAVK